MAFLGNRPVSFGDSADFEFDDAQHDDDETDDEAFQPPRYRTGAARPNDCDEERRIGSRIPK